MKKSIIFFYSVTICILIFVTLACNFRAESCKHIIDNGSITKYPGFSEGSKTYKCKICNEIMIVEKIPALGYCEKPIDAETYMDPTKDSKYIFFGMFPQSRKNDDVIINDKETYSLGISTYYKGNDGELYSEYNFVYYKVEPIKWRVLTTAYDYDGDVGVDTGMLLMSDKILTANIPFYESTQIGPILKHRNGSFINNYKESQIRAYLNGISYDSISLADKDKWTNKGFLQIAFTDKGSQLIKTTTVDNSGESTTDAKKNIIRADGYESDGITKNEYEDYTCENTKDKIFLLSLKEVTLEDYGFSDYDDKTPGNNRILFPTDYAISIGAFQDYDLIKGCIWWLRSPNAYDYNSVEIVYPNGYTGKLLYEDTNLNGMIDEFFISNYSNGIVPALVLKY